MYGEFSHSYLSRQNPKKEDSSLKKFPILKLRLMYCNCFIYGLRNEMTGLNI